MHGIMFSVDLTHIEFALMFISIHFYAFSITTMIYLALIKFNFVLMQFRFTKMYQYTLFIVYVIFQFVILSLYHYANGNLMAFNYLSFIFTMYDIWFRFNRFKQMTNNWKLRSWLSKSQENDRLFLVQAKIISIQQSACKSVAIQKVMVIW